MDEAKVRKAFAVADELAKTAPPEFYNTVFSQVFAVLLHEALWPLGNFNSNGADFQTRYETAQEELQESESEP